MSLHRSDLPVLQAALRTRITEPERLAEMVRLPVAGVREALERLTAEGLIVRTADGRPALPPPQQPLVDAALAQVRSQLAVLEAVRASLEAMPSRLRHWVDAQADERAEVRMELAHGPDAIIDTWWRLGDQGRLVDAFGCFPDATALARLAAGDALNHPRAGSRIRIIAGRAGADAETRAAVESLQERGVELRTLERMPGWFAGEGGERSAFPTAWGVAWPLSVRLLRDPIAARSLRSFFDELWRRAAPTAELPFDGVPEGWESVLRLLETGLGDAEVADTLGMSERTVRRRIEEAMLDLGAVDRFTLGRAWAARR